MANGRQGIQPSAHPHEATANSQQATTPLLLKRSTTRTASSAAMGRASRVAQNANRSKVSTSKARPSSSRGMGVVPPSPSKNVAQKPKNKGRKRRSVAPFQKMNGKASSSAP